VEFRILGPLEARAGGRSLALGGTKRRAVLAQLALRAGETVPADRLVAGLWVEPPGTAAKALQVHVSELRKALAPQRPIRTEARGYVLDGETDLARCEALRAEAAGAAPARAAALLRDALALWRGEPLAEFAAEPFAAAEAVRLDELRVAVLEERLGADLLLGRHAEAVGELEALVAAYPLREGLRTRLMLALYRSGRQAEALESYRAARSVLVEELGIEPGPELQRLERAILEHDPSLAPAAAPQPPPLPVVAPDSLEVRKTVTVVFCDVVSSTSVGERHDPELMRRVLARYFEEMRRALEAHGGTIEKFIGDAVMAVFGTPVMHEDDALRALRAAAEMRRRLEALNDELESTVGVRLEARIGVNSGKVVAGDPSRGETFVTGDAVAVAQRLEARAPPGEIFVGELTYRLARESVRVEAVGPLLLKGKAAAVQAYRLLDVDGVGSGGLRLGSPMVGRGRERLLLQDAFGRAVQLGACHLFTVLGPAGVGKSRLVAEAIEEIGDRATVVTGACLPYGEGITYHPLRELVEALEALPELLEQAPEQLFRSVRRLLEEAAREEPLVVVFDDVHWGEPTFLDLIEHVADWVRDAPLLLVCMARPELLDLRPAWGGGKLNATAIFLEPLAPSEIERLARNLLGSGDLDDDLALWIGRTAGGNPLFVEEMVALALEEGLIREERGRWRVAGDADLPVPPSIQVLLASRLDLLPPDERRTLERAAVQGQRFDRAAVEHLAEHPAHVGDCLQALVRKELIRAEQDEVYRFRHLLIRDAAYDALPKQIRGDLHERLAPWLDDRGEEAEFVGYHLEQAVRYRVALGQRDARTERLGVHAGELLGAAGERAASLGDIPAAISLLGRADALLPAQAPLRARLLATLGSVLMRAGEFDRAGAVLDAAVDAAQAAGDRRTELRALVERQFQRSFTSPDGAMEEDSRVAAAAIAELEVLGDDLGLAKAWRLLSEAHAIACQWGARADALERALVHARRAPEARHDASAIAALLAQALAYGPTPVEDAILRCRELLAEAADDRLLTAGIGSALGGLHAMRGDFDEARRLAGDAVGVYEELGLRFRRAARSLVPAQIELLAGNPEAAERELRSACETLEAMGERGVRATLSAFLADVLVTAGDDDGAEAFAGLAGELAARDDLVPQVLRRTVLARLLARRGKGSEAAALACEAVELIAPTDFLELRARALEALAAVLAAAGRTGEAREALADASMLHEQKGNRVAVRRLDVSQTALVNAPAQE
jgi:class 3 adenylate cyclase/DNA-binding winged helix-turn-helix (wHTH) protein